MSALDFGQLWTSIGDIWSGTALFFPPAGSAYSILFTRTFFHVHTRLNFVSEHCQQYWTLHNEYG